MKKIQLITDGACIGNPGPGGWAYILRFGDRKKEDFGYEQTTTNNRMELRAAIEGLKALREPCEVVVVTDSQYVKRGITEWIAGWKKQGWQKRTRDKSGSRAVLNVELWKELEAACEPHSISWEWVRGHANHEDNNRCDALALRAAQQRISSEKNSGFLSE